MRVVCSTVVSATIRGMHMTVLRCVQLARGGWVLDAAPCIRVAGVLTVLDAVLTWCCVFRRLTGDTSILVLERAEPERGRKKELGSQDGLRARSSPHSSSYEVHNDK